MSVSDISVFPEASLPAAVSSGTSSAEWGTEAKMVALKVASYLYEPICKVRECFYTFYILDKTCKETSQKVMRAAALVLGIVAYSLLSPLTSPFGAAIRGMVAAFESKPYVYLQRSEKGKSLPDDHKITLVSHNQCYMPGGYSITDGQVTPPSDSERMNSNIQKIKELDPDIVCLYEVPDVCDADSISSRLPDHPFIIPVAGMRAIGPSSGMYIASKYEIVKDSIEFVPFVKGVELTGRGQFSEKGFLSFDVKSRGGASPFATVISTHLQHSEIPEIPEDEERRARFAQMMKIAKQIQAKMEQGKAVIFTGDLNQDENEMKAFLDRSRIDWLRRDPTVQGMPTWGGDKWCADLMGKPASGSLVLDYTLIAGKTASISTKIIENGYSGLEFRPNATSDHNLLFSTVTLG